MLQDLETYTISELPWGYSQSMLDVLQSFMDRLGLPEDAELLEGPDSDLPVAGPQSTVSELADLLHPQDADSAEAMQLARALTAKVQRHMRKNAPVDYDDLVEMEICILSLDLKPDGMERARERGARETEGNFLTLETTKRLISFVFDHVPHSTNLNCRIVTEIILLRLAAVLNNDAERIYLLTDYPIRSVQLDDDPSHSFGGVVDYVLAKYRATPQQHSPENVSKTPRFRKFGSANIFEMKSVGELLDGLPQCILTTASWCRQLGGEEAMRGAATNGQFWIFFSYKRGTERSYYARSDIFHVQNVLSSLDWILGILIDWVENTGCCDAFEDFETPLYD